MESIEDKVTSRIYGNKRGWSFFKNDFIELGSDLAIRKALKELGQERIDDATLKHLADKWSPSTWKKILRDTKTAPV